MRPIGSMKFNDSAPQQNWQAIRLICERGAQAPLVVQTAFCRQHSSTNPLPRSDPRTLMQGWSVSQAVAFLHSVDLDGAAEVCHHNGVSGDDLLTMTAATLTGDLRVSPFLAKKMLRARDCYLDAAVM